MKKLFIALLIAALLLSTFAMSETAENQDGADVETGDGIYTVEFGEGVTLADNDYYTITLTGDWRIPENNGALYLWLSIVNKTDASMNLLVGSWNAGECDTINGVEKPICHYNEIQAAETFEHEWDWFTGEIIEDAHDVREMVIHFSAQNAETKEELPQSKSEVRVLFPEDTLVEPVEVEPEPVDVTFAEGAMIADNDYVTVTLTGEDELSDYGYFKIGFKIINKTDRRLCFQVGDPGKEPITVNGQEVHASSAIGVDANGETTDMNGPNVESLGIKAVEQVKEMVIAPMVFDPDTQERFTDGFDIVRILF